MTRILLADPTYDRRSPSPLIVPLALGLIGSKLKDSLGDAVEVTLVKSVESCVRAIQERRWDVAAFSYFVWNARLSLGLARHLRSLSPSTAIAIGGANIPIDQSQKERLVLEEDYIDFFVEKDGELPVLNLIKALMETGFDIDRVKAKAIPSIRSQIGGRFIDSPLEERIMNLDEVPSPYLNGMMDKFMEEGYTPAIVNNRGCPFKCDFCGEGGSYYNKVAKRTSPSLFADYDYIAKKMASLKDCHPFPGMLQFADSNAGMYPQDEELYRYLGEIRRIHGWPSTIISSTGKNRKDKVVERISLLGGAMALTASVQTTDEEVLRNINRENVSTNDLMTAAKGRGEGSRSFSELILALPGDSYERHLASIRDMVDCQINLILSNQLMVLADTPMAAPDYIEKFGLVLKKRILVKGVARIPAPEGSRVIAETETICVGTDRMQSRPGKFGQVDKWISCLKAATMPRRRKDHDETFTPDAFAGIQGEGGFGRHQGRQDAGRVGSAV